LTKGICPKCGNPGSLHLKMIRNKVGRSYRYYYFSHYNRWKGKNEWHYIGKLEKVRHLLTAQVSNPKRFKCLICGRWRFKTWQGIHRHMKVHGISRWEDVRANIIEIEW